MLWWLGVVGAVAVVFIIWTVATIPFDMMFAIVSTGNNMGTQQLNILATISRYWNLAPQVLILVLIAYGFFRTIKRERVTYER
jgi:hypothetical protein